MPAPLNVGISPDVTLTVNSVAANDFCLSAVNANLPNTEIWYYSKSGGGNPTSTKPAGCA